MIQKSIVIARYKEDLSWIDSIPSDYNVIIYDKSPANSKKIPNAIKLPNVGREAHTYLRYIVDNYNSLPDVTVFAQGNPFDHCHGFINLLGSVPANGYYDFNCINTFVHITPLGIFRAGVQIFDADFAGYVLGAVNGLYNTNHTVIKLDVSHFAIFSVSRDLILKHPLSFYLELFNHTINDPRGAFTLELLWQSLFVRRYNG